MLNGFIRRMWRKYGINKIVVMKTGIELVRFDFKEGKMEVIQEVSTTWTINP